MEQDVKNPYQRTEDRGIGAFSSAVRPPGMCGSVALRLQVTLGLLFSENCQTVYSIF